MGYDRPRSLVGGTRGSSDAGDGRKGCVLCTPWELGAQSCEVPVVGDLQNSRPPPPSTFLRTWELDVGGRVDLRVTFPFHLWRLRSGESLRAPPGEDAARMRGNGRSSRTSMARDCKGAPFRAVCIDAIGLGVPGAGEKWMGQW